ncbi:MAG: PAS domain S-box protein [Candidatus Thorarchaeota archaeon]
MVRALLVDDDKNLLFLAKRILKGIDPELAVVNAISGRDALAKLSEESFDVVVADYKMPGMTGLDLLEQMRENDDMTPFIIFTGKGKEEVAMQALNLGADYYIRKEYNFTRQYRELIHIIHRVVDHSRTKEELEKSELRFRRTFEAIPDPAFLWERQAEEIILTKANRAAIQVSGGIIENQIGSELESYYQYEPGIGHSIRQIMLSSRTQKEERYLKLHANGKPRWYLLDYVKPTDDSVLVIAKGLSDRKRVEEALLASVDQYRRFVETAQEGILIVDTHAITTFVNDRMAEMLGFTREEMLEQHVFNFIDKSLHSEAKGHFNFQSSKIREHQDFLFRRKDGSELWTILSTNPMLDSEGYFVGVLAMAIDITDRKYAEHALIKSEERYREVQGQLERAARG